MDEAETMRCEVWWERVADLAFEGKRSCVGGVGDGDEEVGDVCCEAYC